jgi:hypothetical protein
LLYEFMALLDIDNFYIDLSSIKKIEKDLWFQYNYLTETDIIMYNYTNIFINKNQTKIWYNRGEKWGK